MKILYILFYLSLTLVGCNSNKTEQQEIIDLINTPPSMPIDDKRLMETLIDSSIKFGNKRAYDEVASNYLVANRGREFLYVSLIVANKYAYARAYFHIFLILSEFQTGDQFERKDTKTKNLAIYSLLKAYELGYDDAKYALEEFFGKLDELPRSSEYIAKFDKD